MKKLSIKINTLALALGVICIAGAAHASDSNFYTFTTNVTGDAYQVKDSKGTLVCSAKTAQEAGDALFRTAKGGDIKIGPGHFKGQWKIRQTDGLTIEGDSDKTVIESTGTGACSFIIGEFGAKSTENKNVTVKNLIFDGLADKGAGGGGIDLNACDTFRLENLSFINGATRSMELSVWTATQAPSMNGVVKNCRFNCGAIVLAGLRNVTLQDLTFTGKLANCNTLIDVSCGEQNAVGMVENVSFKNITVDNISGHYVDGNKNVHPMDCLIGGFEYIKNVSFDNVKIDCPTEMPNAFKYFSNATSAVQDVTLSNSSLSNVCSIWNIPNATITNTTFKNFKYALNAPGVTLKKCTFENSNVQKENAFSTGDILIYCRANSNVVIDGCTFEDTQSSPTTPQAIEIESSTKFTITNCKFLGPFTTGNALVMRGTCDAYKIVGNQHVQDQSKGV